MLNNKAKKFSKPKGLLESDLDKKLLTNDQKYLKTNKEAEEQIQDQDLKLNFDKIQADLYKQYNFNIISDQPQKLQANTKEEGKTEAQSLKKKKLEAETENQKK